MTFFHIQHILKYGSLFVALGSVDCVGSSEPTSDADKSDAVAAESAGTCGLTTVDDVSSYGASSQLLLNPADGDRVRIVARLYWKDGRFIVKWPCPDMSGTITEIFPAPGSCMPKNRSVVIFEGKAQREVYETGSRADGPGFRVLDAKPLALVRDVALCHGPSKP